MKLLLCVPGKYLTNSFIYLISVSCYPRHATIGDSGGI